MHTQYPLVSIVILTFNGKHYLQKFLPSVIASTYANVTIVVADNGSTDGTIEWLRQHHANITIVENGKNYGFAKGYNVALQQVQADYFVLLNSDVEVTQGWIEPVIALMETNKNIAACQPKLLDYNQPNKFEYAGACGGWMDALGYPFSRGRVFDFCEVDNGQYNTNEAVFWASGAAFFVRAGLFKAAGGFDDYFFAHQEEIDLCWRLQRRGFDIMVCPASVVYHVGGGTLPQGQRKVFLNFRNNLVMIVKNEHFLKLLWKLPARFALDAVAAWKNIPGDPSFFLAVAKAHLAFMGWLCTHLSILFTSKKNDETPKGKYNGLVVVDFFIRKRKIFSEIVFKKYQKFEG